MDSSKFKEHVFTCFDFDSNGVLFGNIRAQMIIRSHASLMSTNFSMTSRSNSHTALVYCCIIVCNPAAFSV
jgi:hypothetical protein